MFLIGCVSSYLPVAINNVEVSDEYALLQTENAHLTVTVDAWTVEPQFLPNYYTTIYVRVLNRTQEYISVNEEDFLLLDENKTQYDLVLPEDVVTLLLNEPSNTTVIIPRDRDRDRDTDRDRDRDRTWDRDRDRFSNDNRYGRDGDPRGRNSTARYNLFKRNIVNKGFGFGEIYPGAAKEGVLYFDKLESSNQEFTLVYKGHEIVFRRR
jgi:hypothetical protein